MGDLQEYFDSVPISSYHSLFWLFEICPDLFDIIYAYMDHQRAKMIMYCNVPHLASINLNEKELKKVIYQSSPIFYENPNSEFASRLKKIQIIQLHVFWLDLLTIRDFQDLFILYEAIFPMISDFQKQSSKLDETLFLLFKQTKFSNPLFFRRIIQDFAPLFAERKFMNEFCQNLYFQHHLNLPLIYKVAPAFLNIAFDLSLKYVKEYTCSVLQEIGIACAENNFILDNSGLKWLSPHLWNEHLVSLKKVINDLPINLTHIDQTLNVVFEIWLSIHESPNQILFLWNWMHCFGMNKENITSLISSEIVKKISSQKIY